MKITTFIIDEISITLAIYNENKNIKLKLELNGVKILDGDMILISFPKTFVFCIEKVLVNSLISEHSWEENSNSLLINHQLTKTEVNIIFYYYIKGFRGEDYSIQMHENRGSGNLEKEEKRVKRSQNSSPESEKFYKMFCRSSFSPTYFQNLLPELFSFMKSGCLIYFTINVFGAESFIKEMFDCSLITSFQRGPIEFIKESSASLEENETLERTKKSKYYLMATLDLTGPITKKPTRSLERSVFPSDSFFFLARICRLENIFGPCLYIPKSFSSSYTSEIPSKKDISFHTWNKLETLIRTLESLSITPSLGTCGDTQANGFFEDVQIYLFENPSTQKVILSSEKTKIFVHMDILAEENDHERFKKMYKKLVKALVKTELSSESYKDAKSIKRQKTLFGNLNLSKKSSANTGLIVSKNIKEMIAEEDFLFRKLVVRVFYYFNTAKLSLNENLSLKEYLCAKRSSCLAKATLLLEENQTFSELYRERYSSLDKVRLFKYVLNFYSISLLLVILGNESSISEKIVEEVGVSEDQKSSQKSFLNITTKGLTGKSVGVFSGNEINRFFGYLAQEIKKFPYASYKNILYNLLRAKQKTTDFIKSLEKRVLNCLTISSAFNAKDKSTVFSFSLRFKPSEPIPVDLHFSLYKETGSKSLSVALTEEEFSLSYDHSSVLAKHQDFVIIISSLEARVEENMFLPIVFQPTNAAPLLDKFRIKHSPEVSLAALTSVGEFLGRGKKQIDLISNTYFFEECLKLLNYLESVVYDTRTYTKVRSAAVSLIVEADFITKELKDICLGKIKKLWKTLFYYQKTILNTEETGAENKSVPSSNEGIFVNADAFIAPIGFSNLTKQIIIRQLLTSLFIRDNSFKNSLMFLEALLALCENYKKDFSFENDEAFLSLLLKCLGKMDLPRNKFFEYSPRINKIFRRYLNYFYVHNSRFSGEGLASLFQNHLKIISSRVLGNQMTEDDIRTISEYYTLSKEYRSTEKVIQGFLFGVVNFMHLHEDYFYVVLDFFHRSTPETKWLFLAQLVSLTEKGLRNRKKIEHLQRDQGGEGITGYSGTGDEGERIQTCLESISRQLKTIKRLYGELKVSDVEKFTFSRNFNKVISQIK